MSQHFELVLSLDLKLDTPQQVIDTLAYMTRTSDSAFDKPPEAPFLGWSEWCESLQSGWENISWPGNLWHVFRKAYRYTVGRQDISLWTFSLRWCMADDGFWWWMAFAEWLAPYSETQGFVGYYVEELGREHPAVIFVRVGHISVLKADEAHAERLVG